MKGSNMAYRGDCESGRDGAGRFDLFGVKTNDGGTVR